MKHLKTLLPICCFAVATSASAQFTDNNAPQTSSPTTEKANGLYISYDMTSVGDLDLDGVSVGYLRNLPLSNSLPFFLEVGGNLQWAYYNKNFDLAEAIIHTLSINAPINLAYQYNVNENFSLRPFIGLNLKFNLLGNVKLSDGTDEIDGSLFSDDDMAPFDAANRFNIGWKVGAAIGYKQFYAGVSYGSDFNEFIMDEKIKTTSITLGYKF